MRGRQASLQALIAWTIGNVGTGGEKRVEVLEAEGTGLADALTKGAVVQPCPGSVLLGPQ